MKYDPSLCEVDVTSLIHGQIGEFQYNGAKYVYSHDGDELHLFSGVCPHAGSVVGANGEAFRCPAHGWEFDRVSGRCTNVSDANLHRMDVRKTGDVIVARLPIHESQPIIQGDDQAVFKNLEIGVVAHSCLHIRKNDFRLITDPWLEGPAMLGAWTQYPPPVVSAVDLDCDAIWISHEHSDHFHEPTLSLFDRRVPIYFPDFPNRRIEQRLLALGFQHIKPMPFGEQVRISPEILLTCYEPTSLWNDAIALIDVAGFKLLNINDAGINHRIARQIGPVHLLASSFTPGASGFPLTWTHLSTEEQDQIMAEKKAGLLHMFANAAEIYSAKYVLPYAGHFALWRPEHREFQARIPRNTMDDVRKSLRGTTTLIDALPGDKWIAADNRVERSRGNTERYYEAEVMDRYLRRNFAQFKSEFEEGASLSAERIDEHFLKLNDVPEIHFCEDLTFEIILMDALYRHEVEKRRYEVRNGVISVSQHTEISNVAIRLPVHVASQIVTDDLSWDEAFIGYWCRFSRSPDVYHAGFWRLLQAPYYRRSPGELPKSISATISGENPVNEILQRHGKPAERIMRRYGLYCAGCQNAEAESIMQAGAAHGLTQSNVERLLKELNSL